MVTSQAPDFSKAVQTLSKKYREENHCTNWDINNGLCADFANDLLQILCEDESDYIHELAGDMFFNVRDPEFAIENWGTTTQTKFGVWSNDMLKHWGLPPGIDITIIDDEINHVWVFANGKHYDAECPNGVDKWFDIPLIRKFFNRYL